MPIFKKIKPIWIARDFASPELYKQHLELETEEELLAQIKCKTEREHYATQISMYQVDREKLQLKEAEYKTEKAEKELKLMWLNYAWFIILLIWLACAIAKLIGGFFG